MNRPTLIAAPTAALLVVVAAGLAGCSPPPPPAAPLPAVYVTPVTLEAGTAPRRFTATVAPRIESELAFRAGGKVTARQVELGQRVRAGQVLARIDAGDYQLAVDAAADQLRAAEVDARQTASDAARFQRLLADGSVPAADQERLQAGADAAAARAAQARRQLDLARNRSSYAVLAAPFDGIVTAVRVEPGKVVAEGQPAFALARGDELELVVDVPERLAATLAAQRASVALPDGTWAPLRLREVAPTANPATRSYRARYALTEARPAAWRLGMSTELRLADAGNGAAVAELPAGALVKTGAQATVWLIADRAAGRLKSQAVTLVAQDRDRVRVLGLQAGDLVVTAGAHKLDAGLRVRAVARPLGAPLPAATLTEARP